jgi:EAL domain-containing protein (putative c-di-GMP-specific phosphodiesterase class I)
LPLHRIKIDRRFVAGMLDQPRTHRIVAAMITMATDLGIDTVAAGVETVEQADALRALGCRSAQGYLFAPAVPEAELVTVLGDMITIAETRSSTR